MHCYNCINTLWYQHVELAYFQVRALEMGAYIMREEIHLKPSGIQQQSDHNFLTSLITY